VFTKSQLLSYSAFPSTKPNSPQLAVKIDLMMRRFSPPPKPSSSGGGGGGDDDDYILAQIC